ncbi:hypothetical protein AWB83_02276 [Caballeronia ptereochthonis]|uniref:Uncharacterized protein n=1 Tax=Caballeronia ptereochthonis TaxID=1777144 RepID=A0A158ASP1_9BURK|nr:hypothetical protein AWB83_02276 [Caballeronia ptereochthonis]
MTMGRVRPVGDALCLPRPNTLFSDHRRTAGSPLSKATSIANSVAFVATRVIAEAVRRARELSTQADAEGFHRLRVAFRRLLGVFSLPRERIHWAGHSRVRDAYSYASAAKATRCSEPGSSIPRSPHGISSGRPITRARQEAPTSQPVLQAQRPLPEVQPVGFRANGNALLARHGPVRGWRIPLVSIGPAAICTSIRRFKKLQVNHEWCLVSATSARSLQRQMTGRADIDAVELVADAVVATPHTAATSTKAIAATASLGNLYQRSIQRLASSKCSSCMWVPPATRCTHTGTPLCARFPAHRLRNCPQLLPARSKPWQRNLSSNVHRMTVPSKTLTDLSKKAFRRATRQRLAGRHESKSRLAATCLARSRTRMFRGKRRRESRRLATCRPMSRHRKGTEEVFMR